MPQRPRLPGTMVVQMDLEEMAFISLALDRVVHELGAAGEFAVLQRKWDNTYRAVHALPHGIVSIDKEA